MKETLSVTIDASFLNTIKLASIVTVRVWIEKFQRIGEVG